MPRAGSPANKRGEVFQGKKSPSLAEGILLGDKNRFRAALAVFKDGPAPKLSDENGDDRATLGVDKDGPMLVVADENGKKHAALSTDEYGSKLHLTAGNGKVVWSAS